MPVERAIPPALQPRVADHIQQDIGFSEPFLLDAETNASASYPELPLLNNTLEHELAEATTPQRKHPYEMPKRLKIEGTLP